MPTAEEIAERLDVDVQFVSLAKSNLVNTGTWPSGEQRFRRKIVRRDGIVYYPLVTEYTPWQASKIGEVIKRMAANPRARDSGLKTLAEREKLGHLR